MKLRYSGVVPQGIPHRVLLITILISPNASAEMYENEVIFYSDIRPDLPLETLRVFASEFDRSNGHLDVNMEDLSQRSVFFPSASQKVQKPKTLSMVLPLNSGGPPLLLKKKLHYKTTAAVDDSGR